MPGMRWLGYGFDQYEKILRLFRFTDKTLKDVVGGYLRFVSERTNTCIASCTDSSGVT